MKKIAILTNIIPPYRLPLFNGLAEEFDLDILICSDNEKNRNWDSYKGSKFNVRKLFGFSFSLKNSLNDYRFIYFKFSILKYLLLNRPDKLIIGDASLTSYFAAFCCKVLGIKYIWWNEVLPFTPIKKGLFDKLRGYSIKNAFHHFVSGTLAKEFIMDYNVKKRKITIIPDAVDNKRYFNYHRKFKPFRNDIKKSYGIEKKDFVILYVGQFIERKNIFLMLKSYNKLYDNKKRIKFIMVGGGKLKEEILDFKSKNNLKGLIIEDFLPSSELAKLYTIADLLILVSISEPWGMVINEAMCFGIPTIVSKFVGASGDLIDEKTGFILNKLSIDNLNNKILKSIHQDWNKNEIKNKIRKWNNNKAIKNAEKILL